MGRIRRLPLGWYELNCRLFFFSFYLFCFVLAPIYTPQIPMKILHLNDQAELQIVLLNDFVLFGFKLLHIPRHTDEPPAKPWTVFLSKPHDCVRRKRNFIGQNFMHLFGHVHTQFGLYTARVDGEADQPLFAILHVQEFCQSTNLRENININRKREAKREKRNYFPSRGWLTANLVVW